MSNKENESCYPDNSKRYRYLLLLLHKSGLYGREDLFQNRIDFEEYLALPPSKAQSLLEEQFEILISGVAILGEENPYGVYNRHDLPHVRAVHKIAHALLDAV